MVAGLGFEPRFSGSEPDELTATLSRDIESVYSMGGFFVCPCALKHKGKQREEGGIYTRLFQYSAARSSVDSTLTISSRMAASARAAQCVHFTAIQGMPRYSEKKNCASAPQNGQDFSSIFMLQHHP